MIDRNSLWRIGWRLLASYFFIFFVFIVALKLYLFNNLDISWVVLLVFLSCSVMAWLLYRRLIIPLGEVATVAQDMAMGNLDQEIRVAARDEIGDLALSINNMARQLKTYIVDVTSEKNRIQAILSSMADGVIAVDNWGRLILINPVVEEIFDTTLPDSQGQNIIKVVRNYELEELLNRSLNTGSPAEKHIEVLTPDPRIFRVHVTPLKNTGGDRGGAVALLRDITEMKRVEEMRTDFVANVSHELRTPLTSIRGFAETLLDGEIDDPKLARQFLGIINAETERLSRLIDELLNLSRIEDRKSVLNWQLIEVSTLIERTVAILEPRAIEKSLSIQVELPEKLPQVKGDPDMLSQVLINLVDNAVSYTQPGGKIRVSAAAGKSELRVYVQDTGIGIPSESQPRVFERFYRVDKARSREQGGTGLGLSIVKHIIDVHGGSVHVDSKVGVGSTFSFSLPLNVEL